jgi:hypothetical protein
MHIHSTGEGGYTGLQCGRVWLAVGVISRLLIHTCGPVGIAFEHPNWRVWQL